MPRLCQTLDIPRICHKVPKNQGFVVEWNTPKTKFDWCDLKNKKPRATLFFYYHESIIPSIYFIDYSRPTEIFRKNHDLPSLGTISTAMLSIWYGPFHKISTKKLCDDWLNLQDRIQHQAYITSRGFISFRRKFLNCQETKYKVIGTTWIKKNVPISRLCAFQSTFCNLSSHTHTLVFRYCNPTILRHHNIVLIFIMLGHHVLFQGNNIIWLKIRYIQLRFSFQQIFLATHGSYNLSHGDLCMTKPIAPSYGDNLLQCLLVQSPCI